MRVMITGGCGFIGSWLVAKLLARDARVWVYDSAWDPSRLKLILPPDTMRDVQHIEGDITDLSQMIYTLQKLAITHVVHLAALQVPTCRTDPINGALVNVVGTLNVFEAMRSVAPQVLQFVYASSCAAQATRGQVGESSAISTHYGAYKRCNEHQANIYWQEHGIPSIGLRPATVYGLGRDRGVTSEVTKAIQAAAQGQRYHISYGGMQDLQYVGDVAEIFLECLDAKPYEASVYDIGGETTSMADFVGVLSDICPQSGGRITFDDNQLPIAYGQSSAALRHRIGDIPLTPLPIGIRKTLSAFRETSSDHPIHVAN